MSAKSGARAYAKVGVETAALVASPHQLIVMLFDGALASIRTARLHMQHGNVAERGLAISKALDIVNEGLLAGLDKERGGEVAAHLEQVYEYVARTLLQANLRSDEQLLTDAEHALEQIAGAWREIGSQQHGQ